MIIYQDPFIVCSLAIRSIRVGGKIEVTIKVTDRNDCCKDMRLKYVLENGEWRLSSVYFRKATLDGFEWEKQDAKRFEGGGYYKMIGDKLGDLLHTKK